MQPTCSDDEFRELFERQGAAGLARHLGIAERNVYTRRRAIEERYGITLKPPSEGQSLPFNIVPLAYEGDAIIFSDCHFWPNVYTDAFWILLKVVGQLRPGLIVCNGDAFDGATISRHPRMGWEQRPAVQAELEAVKERLGMISAPQLCWNLGNHDLRFDMRLATVAPEYEGVAGTRLKDHFPNWKFQWGLMINDQCVIKHRYKGGIHAARNNTLNSGVSTITGHDHHLQVIRYSDYRGVRYGVQGGTLADIHGEMFAYTEGNPVDWQSGFVVAHFDKEDHWIEVVEVKHGRAHFGGKTWKP